MREIWFDWLRQYRPDLVPRYEELYRRGAYMPAAEREQLAARARGGSRPRRFTVQRGTQSEPKPRERRPRARQASLF